ncbi:hypothetical protein ACJJIC_17420 [Microbulbifer sp. ANSA002]|uniref:hypothetical protein n=1 Tax=unclassified Microbulbifer TaxID=2619833 RepID=UPI004041B8A1
MMFKGSFEKIASLCLFAFTSLNALALDDEDKAIRLVEALSGNKVYIHLKEPMNKQPSCSKWETIIACSTDNSYCSHALSIALAAQASNRTIDFQTSESSCVGDAAEFVRLRMR